MNINEAELVQWKVNEKSKRKPDSNVLELFPVTNVVEGNPVALVGMNEESRIPFRASPPPPLHRTEPFFPTCARPF